MIDTFRKIVDLLDARERRHAALLLGMMFVMGLLEVAGVASIMPFITVVANPGVIHSNAYLAAAYRYFDVESDQAFLLIMGTVVFVLVVGGLVFKALTHWAIARYTYMRTASLGIRLLRGYLGRPYTFFLNRHSADLGKTVLAEVNEVVKLALTPGMHLLGNGIVATFIIILIVLVDPTTAIIAVALVGGTYAAIYAVLRKYLKRIGTDRLRANQERFQIAQEAFGGIKDVKVLGLENGYLQTFRRPATSFARRQAANKIIGELPRFILEALMFGGMLGLLLVLLATRGGDLGAVLPLITLYAFAGSRLIPALQRVYVALTQLQFGGPALDALHRDLVETGMTSATSAEGVRDGHIQSIPLRERIELKNIAYTYPQAPEPTFRCLDMTIPANSTVALVGSTGAGKTTVVDLILGLLVPQEGEVRVDGVTIGESNKRAWQRSLGYVPQHIFLADDTVSGNIAFGIPEKEVDHEAVEQAARVAELHDFVVQEMPQGYATMVGERGVRLSGGQRQRIGIARALYHDPDVLILDEATSALDNLTEQAVMNAVDNLAHRKTVILIAHRLSTVRKSDIIFMLERGEVIASGTYDQLMLECASFREMCTGELAGRAG